MAYLGLIEGNKKMLILWHVIIYLVAGVLTTIPGLYNLGYVFGLGAKRQCCWHASRSGEANHLLTSKRGIIYNCGMSIPIVSTK